MFTITINISGRAVAGAALLGVVIATSSLGVVRAEHDRITRDSQGVYKCSSGTACVEGYSTGTKTWGVYGHSSIADAVHAETGTTTGNSAVSGLCTNTSGKCNGVYGYASSLNDVAVYASADNKGGGTGVYAIAGGIGVSGFSAASNGVQGVTKGAGMSGVAGEDNETTGSGNGVFAGSSDETGAYQALEARGNSGNTNIFYGSNSANNVSCMIDNNANLKCSGTVSGSAVQVRHRTSGGQRVLAYAAESTSATLEDFGTATLFGGVANVAIEREFGGTIDRNTYEVFLSPLGDTRGLYVSMKTPGGFQVREAEHGRGTIAFDYRIIARPLDARGGRLPLAHWRRVT